MDLPNPPRLSFTEAANVLRKLYGISSAISLKPLESYDDQNYLVQVLPAPIRCAEVDQLGSSPTTVSSQSPAYTKVINGNHQVPCSSNNEGTKKFVLKIIHSAGSMGDARKLGEVQAQCREALRHSGLPCCKTVPTIDDRLQGLYDSSTGSSAVAKADQNWRGVHTVEVHEFLPGVALRNYPNLQTTPAVFLHMGKLVGRVRKVWASTSREQFPSNATPFWNIERGPEVEPLFRQLCAKDVEDRLLLRAKGRDVLVNKTIKNFRHEFASRKSRLQVSIIHGDINDNNVLLVNGGESGPLVSGLLDFSDCCVSYAVLDIALTMTYMMLMCSSEDNVQNDDNSKPIEAIDAAGLTLAGYLQEAMLNEEELRFLPYAIAMRLVQSVVMGAYTYTFLQPDNEYLLQTAEVGWRALTLITGTDTQDVLKRWNSIVQQMH